MADSEVNDEVELPPALRIFMPSSAFRRMSTLLQVERAVDSLKAALGESYFLEDEQPEEPEDWLNSLLADVRLDGPHTAKPPNDATRENTTSQPQAREAARQGARPHAACPCAPPRCPVSL